jgi:hypothetical protein
LVGNETQGKTLSMKLCPAFEDYGANQFPGPGTYQTVDPNIRKSKQPTWRIGSSTRDDQLRTMRRTCNFPPPSAYNP